MAKPGNAKNLWLPDNPSKRWTEVLYMAYSPFWMTWALCILVPLQLFEYCDELGYLLIGICTAAPTVVLPLIFPCKADVDKPWHQRYWVKANIWIAIFSYVGNYFWTHYFFKILGAAYTFPSYKLNQVPFTLYLMTHAYFHFYHTLSNMLLRRLSRAMSKSYQFVRLSAMAVLVFSLSYATAYMETLTISHFPYYTFVDRDRMYLVGSLFYAIYFFVSFPMFYVMDEEPQTPRWTLWQAAVDSLAASMLVTILLDLWRISFGAIVDDPVKDLPWL